jgi:hypothetical protein
MSDTNDDYRQKDIKKSKFPVVTILNDTAYVDAVENNQNVKILLSDYIKLFGTTGKLEQLGEVISVPILNKSGTTNQIRNLVSGSGILLSTSSENGAEISHNIANGSGGADIFNDLTAEQIVAKNIAAGSGISVTEEDDKINIAISGTPTAINTVIVNEMSDFPAAVAGVRTLEPTTQYFVQNFLTTSDRFILDNRTVIQGADASVTGIEYTGSGNMFTSANSLIKIAGLTVQALSGTFIDWSGVYEAGNRCLIRDAAIIADTLGSIESCDGFSLFNTQLVHTTAGFTFTGTNGFLGISDFISASTAGTLFDLSTSVSDSVSIRNAIVDVDACCYLISGLVDSGNIASGKIGNAINVSISGDGDFAENILPTDARWEFHHNEGIEDSITSILSLHSGGTFVITAVDTPVIIDDTWTHTHESRFEGTAGGRFTYTGKGGHININGAISAIGVVPTTREFEFLLYKNGVAITDAVFPRGFNNVGAGSLPIVWQEDMETGDYLELWLQNIESDDNLTILNITLGISG